DDKTVRVWDVATGRCRATLEGHTAWVSSVALTADGRTAVSGAWDKTVRVWDVATGRCRDTLEGHTAWVYSVALTADGRTAVSGSWDGTVRVWEVATGRCLEVYPGYSDDAQAWFRTRNEPAPVSSDLDSDFLRLATENGAVM